MQRSKALFPLLMSVVYLVHIVTRLRSAQPVSGGASQPDKAVHPRL